jgi:hypothetical protein
LIGLIFEAELQNETADSSKAMGIVFYNIAAMVEGPSVRAIPRLERSRHSRLRQTLQAFPTTLVIAREAALSRYWSETTAPDEDEV